MIVNWIFLLRPYRSVGVFIQYFVCMQRDRLSHAGALDFSNISSAQIGGSRIVVLVKDTLQVVHVRSSSSQLIIDS